MAHTKNNADQNNTYVMNNADDAREMLRVLDQGVIFTDATGGPLNALIPPHQVHHALNLACGPGEWELRLARDHPHIDILGIDVSQTMIDYAQAQANQLHLEQVHFQRRSITPVPESSPYPDIFSLSSSSFDLIDARLIISVIALSYWPELLQECLRLLRPGGYLQLTEWDCYQQVNAPYLGAWFDLILDCLARDGRIYPHGGITVALPVLLQKAGFTLSGEQAFTINFSYGTKAHLPVRDDILNGFSDMFHFIRKFHKLSEKRKQEFQGHIQQELDSMETCIRWYGTTIIARKPEQ